MSKDLRNIIITAVVAGLLGYIAGGAMQTGRCPITGMVLCKQKAAACDRMKEECCKKDSCPTETTAPSTPATETK